MQGLFRDAESQKEFMALQTKLIEASKQLSLATATLQYKQQEKKRNELTLKEMGAFDDSVNTYQSVGRMFLLSKPSELKGQLNKTLQENDSDIEALKKNVEYLERVKKEGEAGIQELVEKKTKELAVS